MNLSSGVTDTTPENHHMMNSQGSFCFSLEVAWGGGSKGNSICLDIRSYGFEPRPLHQEQKAHFQDQPTPSMQVGGVWVCKRKTRGIARAFLKLSPESKLRISGLPQK